MINNFQRYWLFSISSDGDDECTYQPDNSAISAVFRDIVQANDIQITNQNNSDLAQLSTEFAFLAVT
jgi:hypothetical protein